MIAYPIKALFLELTSQGVCCSHFQRHATGTKHDKTTGISSVLSSVFLTPICTKAKKCHAIDPCEAAGSEGSHVILLTLQYKICSVTFLLSRRAFLSLLTQTLCQPVAERNGDQSQPWNSLEAYNRRKPMKSVDKKKLM